MLERVELEALFERAAQERLVGVVGPRLRELGWAQASEAFERRAAAQIAYQAARNRTVSFTSLWLEGLLRSAGVPVLPLKGPELGARLYGAIDARASTDVDLLVHIDRMTEATDVLTACGYRALPDIPAEGGARPRLHRVLVHDARPPVELHWRLHWYERSFADDLLATIRAREGYGELPPELELACLLLFYARDGLAGLRLASDVAAWWDVRGADLAPTGLDAVVERHPGLARALITASSVAGDVVGLPPVISRRHPPGALSRARTLADWRASASASQHTAEVSLVNVLLGTRRLPLLREELFPSDEVRRTWSSWNRSGSLLVHPVARLLRWCFAFVRVPTSRASGRLFDRLARRGLRSSEWARPVLR